MSFSLNKPFWFDKDRAFIIQDKELFFIALENLIIKSMHSWLYFISNLFSIKKLFNTSFCSSILYLSEHIIVNLDNTASDNLFCSPNEHVANILKFSPKFENSLYPSLVKVS